jgi:amidase
VIDAAILLGALESSIPDPHDPMTNRCPLPPNRDYTVGLRADGLRGARIGIPRAGFYDPVAFSEGSGLNADQATLMAEAMAILRQHGAIVVDPANIPSVVDPDPDRNILRWEVCSGAGAGRSSDSACSIDFKYGMKRDFNAWLASLGPSSPVKTLSELRAWNEARRDEGAIKYGQSNLDISDEIDLERDKARYEADRAKDLRLSTTHGIDEIMIAERLDAVLFPGPRGASLAAKAGYPTVIVPFGMVPNSPRPSFPPGFNANAQPFGVSFTGMACTEPRLLELAYAFEQATRRRVAPPDLP